MSRRYPCRREEGCQHKGDIASGRLSAQPEQQNDTNHRRPQDQQHHALRGAVDRAPVPGASRAVMPLGDNLGQSLLLACLRAKAFHHRIAADRICKRAAKSRVPRVGEPCCGRDIGERQDCRDSDENERADRDDQAHHRPIPAKQHRRAHEHDDGREQRDKDRVVQQVECPHATGNFTHC